jgi:hypothetical protein
LVDAIWVSKKVSRCNKLDILFLGKTRNQNTVKILKYYSYSPPCKLAEIAASDAASTNTAARAR